MRDHDRDDKFKTNPFARKYKAKMDAKHGSAKSDALSFRVGKDKATLGGTHDLPVRKKK